MSGENLTRRDLLLAASGAAVAGRAVAIGSTRASSNEQSSAFAKALDTAISRYVAAYMAAMNTPGLTLAITDKRGGVYLRNFGLADLSARTPIPADSLFQIGSITKSFTAILVLQLQDEGKLRVQDPILRYLPELPIEPTLGQVAIHHLLCHSSGFRRDGAIFPGDASRQAPSFASGSQYHYSNWAYGVLGMLVERCSGQPFATVLSRRILDPLGMSSTAPQITSGYRGRIVASYVPMHDDRPYPRFGPLTPAGPYTFVSGAGCIASTAADMARYVRMLLNRGVGPAGRILSEEAFTQFSSRHIAAPEFGRDTSYGYGVAVYTYDGHEWLRHSGGMPSFRSAMHMDLDSGIAAFASINTNQNYGPTAITRYAVQLGRALQERTSVPAVPPADEDALVPAPADYVGEYISSDGRRLLVDARESHLELQAESTRIPLQRMRDDQFLTDHPRLDLYPLLFCRGSAPAGASASASVVALCHGADTYQRTGYPASDELPDPAGLTQVQGLYACTDPQRKPIRVVVRQGRVWMDGVSAMDSLGGLAFRSMEEPWSPEIARFTQIVNGKAQVLRFEGVDRYRIGEHDSR